MSNADTKTPKLTTAKSVLQGAPLFSHVEVSEEGKNVTEINDPTETTEKKYSKLNRKEGLVVKEWIEKEELIESMWTEKDDNGVDVEYCRYKNNMTDAQVAQLVNDAKVLQKTCTKGHIDGIRNDFFGKKKKAPIIAKDGSDKSLTIKTIQNYVRTLQSENRDLKDRVSKIEKLMKEYGFPE